jgi:hypothetical protein
MDFIIEHWKDIVAIITSLVTGASIVVRLTPTKKDDEALGKVMKILNLVAINPKK